MSWLVLQEARKEAARIPWCLHDAPLSKGSAEVSKGSAEVKTGQPDQSAELERHTRTARQRCAPNDRAADKPLEGLRLPGVAEGERGLISKDSHAKPRRVAVRLEL